MIDLTSSLYSLVVLSSATMGLSQYLKNSFSSSLTGQKDRLKKDWGQFDPNTFGVHRDKLTSGYDSLMAQPDLDVNRSVYILAALLPLTAFFQAVGIGKKAFVDGKCQPGDWCYLILEMIVPGIVILMYLASIYAISELLIKLRSFSSGIDRFKDSKDSLVSMANTIQIAYNDGANSATNGGANPVVAIQGISAARNSTA